jgi:hypothetical protein
VAKHNAMRETSDLEKATDGRRGLSLLLAAVSMLGISVGFAQASIPGRAAFALAESTGPHVGVATPAGHNIRLASQLPKISTPRVHVNVGTHVNTGNVHPVTGANSNTFKFKGANSQSTRITSAHQLDKNNGGKGKGAGNTKGGNTNPGGSLLKLDGVDGESMDSGHANQTDIQ